MKEVLVTIMIVIVLSLTSGVHGAVDWKPEYDKVTKAYLSGDFKESERLAANLLEETEKSAGKEGLEYGLTLLLYGISLREQRQYKKAVNSLYGALKILHKIGGDADFELAVESVASNHYFLNRHIVRKRHYDRAQTYVPMRLLGEDAKNIAERMHGICKKYYSGAHHYITIGISDLVIILYMNANYIGTEEYPHGTIITAYRRMADGIHHLGRQAESQEVFDNLYFYAKNTANYNKGTYSPVMELNRKYRNQWGSCKEANLISGKARNMYAKQQYAYSAELGGVAYEMFKETLGEFSIVPLDVQLIIAKAHFKMGDYGRARSISESAWRLAFKFEIDNVITKEFTEVYAESCYFLKDYGESLKAFRLLLRLNNGAKHKLEWISDCIGTILSIQGKEEEAEKYYVRLKFTNQRKFKEELKYHNPQKYEAKEVEKKVLDKSLRVFAANSNELLTEKEKAKRLLNYATIEHSLLEARYKESPSKALKDELWLSEQALKAIERNFHKY